MLPKYRRYALVHDVIHILLNYGRIHLKMWHDCIWQQLLTPARPTFANLITTFPSENLVKEFVKAFMHCLPFVDLKLDASRCIIDFFWYYLKERVFEMLRLNHRVDC